MEWHEFGIDLEIQVDDRGYYILNDSDETKNKNECLELIKELTGKASCKVGIMPTPDPTSDDQSIANDCKIYRRIPPEQVIQDKNWSGASV